MAAVPPPAVAETAKDARQRRQGPWLHAWHDGLANLDAHGASLGAADLGGDGEYSLLVACRDRKLKVCKGLVKAAEQALPEVPVALRVFYTDANAPRAPAVAVAGGSAVYIYRSLRPYFKFNLPPVEIAEAEVEIWDRLRSQDLEASAAAEALERTRDEGTRLSARSQDFLALAMSEAQEAFLQKHLGLPHQQQTVVTCMEVIKKSQDTVDAVSSLVIGTEHCQVLMLDPPGSAIVARILLPSVPVLMAVTGIFDVEWRIVVACRDGRLYTIKSGEVRGSAVVTRNVIELEAPAVGLVRAEAFIYAGTMERQLQAFHLKGRRAFSLKMPRPITNMAPMIVTRSNVVAAVLVALEGGEVRCYREKRLVARLDLGESVTALFFGQYGREDNTLVAVTASGSLHVKMLQRKMSLAREVADASDDQAPKMLQIPKKTKLYVQQAQRERQLAGDMHRRFQADLCQLRLTTARAYVQLLADGGMGTSTVSDASVRLDARVTGIGPQHRLTLRFTNTSATVLTNLEVLLRYDKRIYRVDRPLFRLSILVPGVVVTQYAAVRNVHPQGTADPVTVLVIPSGANAPLLNYRVSMPVSELAEDA